MLEQENALPLAERDFSLNYWDGQTGLRQRCAHVRGHIVQAFCSMDEQRITIWHKAIKKRLHIYQHVRIIILVNEQTGGSVLNIKREQTCLQTQAVRPIKHLQRDVVELATMRFNTDLLSKLAHKNISAKKWAFETVKLTTVKAHYNKSFLLQLSS